jgi:hypothetical protein
MVAREQLMHLIAHNLVCMLMAQGVAQRPEGQQALLLFKGTLDRNNQLQGALWVCAKSKQGRERHDTLLSDISKDEVRQRPGR